jgi:CRISPR-associated protein Csx14
LHSRPRDEGYPFPDPPSPATVACVLRRGDEAISIEHWGDETVRDNVKFWAGAAGYPGVALARDALELVREHAVASASDPFALAAPQSSSFRLDWRRDYIPIDAGFSLNVHGGRIETVGFPLVELLGAIGLGHARPARPSRRNKLEYVYGAAGRSPRSAPELWLPPSILRAALGAVPLPFPTRRFRMLLGWPGKEGQARAITTVTEETTV